MNANEPQLPAPPRALLSTNPLQWIRFFGPGAILASVTGGSGEILFPSRGGAIFGYKILWVILFVAFLKWIFVYTSIRHMILSGGQALACLGYSDALDLVGVFAPYAYLCEINVYTLSCLFPYQRLAP